MAECISCRCKNDVKSWILPGGCFSQVWTSNNPLGKPCVYILAGMLPNLIFV